MPLSNGAVAPAHRETATRLPLPSLGDGFGHIHGRLDFEVSGRHLPHMGYFGPDDVCLGDWLCELRNAVAELQAYPNGCYVYDWGEQCQPAFEFRRDHETLYISIIDSEISEGEADPDWQRVPCDFAELALEVQHLMERFKETVYAAAPSDVADRWWSRVFR